MAIAIALFATVDALASWQTRALESGPRWFIFWWRGHHEQSRFVAGKLQQRLTVSHCRLERQNHFGVQSRRFGVAYDQTRTIPGVVGKLVRTSRDAPDQLGSGFARLFDDEHHRGGDEEFDQAIRPRCPMLDDDEPSFASPSRGIKRWTDTLGLSIRWSAYWLSG